MSNIAWVHKSESDSNSNQGSISMDRKFQMTSSVPEAGSDHQQTMEDDQPPFSFLDDDNWLLDDASGQQMMDLSTIFSSTYAPS
ncbi:hypothetical protein FRX31_026996 [Thalictrum thalictroides]|uniref:Uncharacterized protein n=1 Tax=Thalictrum thalictroides TaxID=46969 RepID=A0A7J6VF94_THATH|nr:hypothetical protein FRX31_026996 [Thalictrum thalictroides]